MARPKTLGPTVTPLDMRTALPRPKEAMPHYATPEHKAWRRAVMVAAKWRCEHPGCGRGYPNHRLHADHVVELRDGGAALDPENGQALCDEHHGQKTAKEQARRAATIASPIQRVT